jgi:hypothetical protein
MSQETPAKRSYRFHPLRLDIDKRQYTHWKLVAHLRQPFYQFGRVTRAGSNHSYF